MNNTNTLKASKSKTLYYAIPLIVILLITVFVFASNKDFKNFFYERLFLTHHHFVPCQELPKKTEVEKVLIENQNDPNRKGLNLSNDLTQGVKGCEDRADLTLMVQNQQEMEAAKKRLGKDFHGIPYRIINF